MIFKENNADKLENRLNDLVDKYYERLGLKDQVEHNIDISKLNVKIGKTIGLGMGSTIMGVGLLSMVATSNMLNGVSELAINGTSVQMIAAGGAVMMAGLGYAGINKLYKIYQENKLENGMEFNSKNELLADMSEKFSKEIKKTTNDQYSMEHEKVKDIEKLLIHNDIEAAKEIIKGIVSNTNINENSEKVKYKNKI